MNPEKITPLMQQYFALKTEYANTLLLFQVGDFYELFFDDAKKAAAFLGIALTKRGTNNGEPIPLCGVPVHALDYYLVKLVRGGFNVAIAEQLEEAVPGKMVNRGVTRVFTPGTLTDSKLLDAKSASYLFSFFPVQHQWGLLFGELLTAQLFATVVPPQAYKLLEGELVRFFPDEILIPDIKEAHPFQSYFKQLGYFSTLVPGDVEQNAGSARGWASHQFKREVTTQMYQHEGLRNALYAFYEYMKKNQEAALEQFKTIHLYKPEDYVMLDSATQKNLELVKNSNDGGAAHTLFSLMDGAATSMGSRMIKKWVMRPLVNQSSIERRLDAVQLLVNDTHLRSPVESSLKEIGDLERVVGRIALRRATTNDYIMLLQALNVLPTIVEQLRAKEHVQFLQSIAAHLADFSALHSLLSTSLNTDTSNELLIKKGYNVELDRLRELADSSHLKIVELETHEQQKTKIQSLKIRYNQVQGYYIEITKANAHLVPNHYIRQQTLVGRERFIMPALRQLQGEIMSAKQEVAAVEQTLFDHVKNEVHNHLSSLRHAAHALAQLDAVLGFSLIAYQHGYSRPIFNDRRDILITQGKHPIVALTLGHQFIPNDTSLTNEESLWIVTGPNMGGKSTYLRQVALISIMAQCGSFIPAQKADLPLLDRVFTRIGAGDNVSGGKSTFLVEMEETALICTQATEKSLVILDEVGRGTSTFDGLAIAQAVVEYLYKQVHARCLFATHYHELTALQDQLPGIVCYHAASKKNLNGILFLYKIVKGTADGSFGLEVAKLASLPAPIITRAQEILTSLTQEQISTVPKIQQSLPVTQQMTENGHIMLQQKIDALQKMVQDREQIFSTLSSINYNELSPRQAFDLLWSLKDNISS